MDMRFLLRVLLTLALLWGGYRLLEQRRQISILRAENARLRARLGEEVARLPLVDIKQLEAEEKIRRRVRELRPREVAFRIPATTGPLP